MRYGKKIQLRTIAFAVSMVFLAFLPGTAGATSKSEVDLAAELRGGYGLYNDLEYVRRLFDKDMPAIKGFEDYPFPITPNDAKLLAVNTKLMADLGSWRQEMVEHEGDIFTEVRIGPALSPGGQATITVYGTNPVVLGRKTAEARWRQNADVSIVEVPYSGLALKAAGAELMRTGDFLRVRPASDFAGLVGVVDAIDAGEGQAASRYRGIGLRVDIEEGEPLTKELDATNGYVALYGLQASAVWITTSNNSGQSATCHSNLVTKNTEGGVTKYWTGTAQHCSIDTGYQYLNAYDGSTSQGGVQTYHSSTWKYNLADGLDIGFFQIPASRATTQMYMRMVNGSRLLRYTIGTANPVVGGTYCTVNQTTRTQAFGFKCGTVNTAGQTSTVAGEPIFGWSMTNASSGPGSSGAPYFLQLPNAQSRVVGAHNGAAGSAVYFGNIIPIMQNYGMSAY